MRKMLLLSAGVWMGAAASVVTYETMPHVTAPTVLSGVTNIISKSADVDICADLTLTDRTFLWLRGDTGTPYVNLAPTADDVTLTIEGYSGFFTAYRYSGDRADAWLAAGIDEPNKNSPTCYYRVRVGTPNGAPGTTGQCRLVLKTNPAFGYNAYSSFWARYLDIETSVSPDPETGMIELTTLNAGVVLDVSQILVKNTAYPVRIKMNGGRILRNNATAVGAPLAPVTDATLILEGVNGQDVLLKKQFDQSDFTGRKGGRVRIIGKRVILTNSGNYPQGVSGWNFRSWRLSVNDNVSWENTGNIEFEENMWLQMQSDDLLPYGPGTGGVYFKYNSGISEATAAAGTQVAYCCLDLCGTLQYVNSVTSSSSDWYRIGVVTNTHASAVGTLVLGGRNTNGDLNAKCTHNVQVRKVGTGMLSVKSSTGEDLRVEAGVVSFGGGKGTVFTNVTAHAGTRLSGTLTVSGTLSCPDAAAAPAMETLNLALTAGATVSCAAAEPLDVLTLTVGGAALPRGVYTAAETDWLTAGTVRVLWHAGDATADVTWTGAGATTAATDVNNWSAATDFSLLGQRPVFATGGVAAEFGAGTYRFSGLSFDAADGFTVTGATGAEVKMLGALELPVPEDTALRTYRVDVPLTLQSSQTITVPTNVTLHLGPVTASADVDIELKGVKTGDLSVYDVAETGTLVLSNAWVSGAIKHKSGGRLELYGEIGKPGDTKPISFDYCRYRNNKDLTAGAVLLGNTVAHGITLYKPLEVEAQGQVVDGCQHWFQFAAGTTNVFKEHVHCVPSTALEAHGGSSNVFEKGVTTDNGAFAPRSVPVNGKAGTFEFKGPVIVNAATRPLAAEAGATLYFRAAGNHAKLYFTLTRGTAWLDVPDAFDDTGLVMGGTEPRVEIGTTHQRFKYIVSGKADDFVAQGNINDRGEFRGAWPSALEVTYGTWNEEAASVTNFCSQINGWVALEKSGAGWHRMRPKAYASYGDVRVSGGTLAFDAGATWLNGTNVTVSGTGTLKLGAGGTFADTCVVSAAGDAWTLDLTGIQKAEEFYVDGRRMPGGVYGSAASAAANKTLAAHFAGTGMLQVKQVGMVFILR